MAKQQVGQIEGELTLTVGDQELYLGKVKVPLYPIRRPRENNEVVAVGITANLGEIRNYVEQVFNDYE